jgi:peptidoglycan/xylan/chitin deacetylase (PgdA/CDA1 family)
MRAVLTYHSIDPSGSPISVDPAAFGRHLAWFGSGAVTVVGLDELVDGPGDDDAVAITFDDGFANLASEAAPRLLDRGLPATVFVVSEHAGRDNAWGGRAAPGIPTLPLLDWEGLGRLAEQGFTIGSHTRTHPFLPRLGFAEREVELAESAATIERRTGRRPRWLAYPYGAVNGAVVDATRRHYSGAVTTDYRPLGVREDRCRIPRLDAYYFQAPGALEAWGRAGFRSGLRIRRVARGVRGALSRAGVLR